MTDEPVPSATEIDSALAATPANYDFQLASAFRQLAAQTGVAGWEILARIFQFRFPRSEVIQPLDPSTDGLLTDGEAAELRARLKEVKDPRFQFRVADILWLTKRDYKLARLAATSYLEAGIKCEDLLNWTSSIDRYERSVSLARQINAKEILKASLDHLEARVTHYNGVDHAGFH